MNFIDYYKKCPKYFLVTLVLNTSCKIITIICGLHEIKIFKDIIIRIFLEYSYNFEIKYIDFIKRTYL